MRHRRSGRSLNRSSPHKHSMLQNMASSLILTEREDELAENAPKVKGRIVTTVAKAKEMRPFLEKCMTIAIKAQAHRRAAAELDSSAERNSSAWKAWRKSARYTEWNQAIAPVVHARRRLLQLLGNKNAVRFLVDELAERFEGRKGGYLRIVKLAKPRLGDAGARALVEFVGVRDRVAQKSSKPALTE